MKPGIGYGFIFHLPKVKAWLPARLWNWVTSWRKSMKWQACHFFESIWRLQFWISDADVVFALFGSQMFFFSFFFCKILVLKHAFSERFQTAARKCGICIRSLGISISLRLKRAYNSFMVLCETLYVHYDIQFAFADIAFVSPSYFVGTPNCQQHWKSCHLLGSRFSWENDESLDLRKNGDELTSHGKFSYIIVVITGM